VDLSRVVSADDFARAIGEAFDVETHASSIWRSLATAIHYRVSPLHVTFAGWQGFEQRMPRYARRLNRILQSMHVERVTRVP